MRTGALTHARAAGLCSWQGRLRLTQFSDGSVGMDFILITSPFLACICFKISMCLLDILLSKHPKVYGSRLSGIMEGQTWKCSLGGWRSFSPWPPFEPLPEPVKGLGLSPREWRHGTYGREAWFTGSCLTASFSA